MLVGQPIRDCEENRRVNGSDNAIEIVLVDLYEAAL
jgi:hypothetical protein